MDVDHFILQNALNEDIILKVEERSSSLDKFILKNVYGLDASDMYYKTSRLGELGSYSNIIQVPALKTREVVLKIHLQPDYSTNETVGDLRDDIYRLIEPNYTGNITLIVNDGLINKASISGVVSRIEAPLSQDTPELQLTILCANPLFEALEVTDLPQHDSNYLINLSDSESTVAHGFEWGIRFTNTNYTGSGTYIKLYMNEMVFKVNADNIVRGELLNRGFINGDELYFSSVLGREYVDIKIDGDVFSIADQIYAGSVWPLIFPAYPTVYYYTDESYGFNEDPVWEDLYCYHRHTYLGV